MSGDLKWNKIFGAGLGTAFVILLVQQASGMVYKTHEPEKMGYFVNAPEEAEGGAEEAVLPVDWGTVLPVADIAAGEAAFARCKACHNNAQGGADGIGPNLYGVVGGPVMHRAGFAYSDAMAKHKGEVTAEVTSATPLTHDQVSALAETLKSRIGKTVTLNQFVDASLIGGLQVKVGSQMIDSSLKTKLAAMKIAMKEVG